jgi:hypothetical protein
MTDRPEPLEQPRDADELTEAVSGLGNTDADRLEEVRQRNESLEERMPSSDELPRTHGTPDQD